MKTVYIQPTIEVIEAEATEIMAGSDPDEKRNISGEPSTDGVNVGVLDGSEFVDDNGHGQGDEGHGNRAKGGYTAWGISWDDEF